MAQVLKDLLTSDEPLFHQAFGDLERSTGGDGVDVQLIADITQLAHNVMRILGLDPADTTARELYLALNAFCRNKEDFTPLTGADFVLMKFGDGVVSFNLVDVIENSHHQLPFEQRILSHGQRALRGEIIQRYLDHPRTDEAVTKDLALGANILVEADKEYPKISTHQSLQPIGKTASADPYILAIGDIFTDAFIKLNEEVARVETDEKGEKRLSLPLGSKPPYDGVEIVKSVGPSPNAAVAFARLGLKSGLRAFLGDDQTAKEAIEYLQTEQVQTGLISTQPGLPSNYYYVLRYGAERTILVKNESYEYTWRDPAEEPSWIYLSLLADASWQLHEDMLKYLEAHPDVKLAFQPGTFHFKWGVEKLRAVYKRSHIVVMNREEAVEVTGKSYDSIADLAHGLHELGPEKVVITDGPNGSYASYDFKLVTIPNYPDPAPPVDRTGAGDAFASTIVAALAQGESMDTALTWAPANSASVVQKVGAQAGLLHKEELLEWLAKAPDWYKVTDLEG